MMAVFYKSTRFLGCCDSRMTMRYKLLGRTGLRVSELCLGAMTFGDDWGWGAPKEECAQIVDAFGEAGGNFIDTANYYTGGSSERIVGELIASERGHWVLSTKYTLNMHPGDPNGGGAHRKKKAWSRRSTRASRGSAPTPSTCTGSTSGTPTRRSRSSCARSTTS